MQSASIVIPLESVYLYKVLFVVGVYAMSVPQQDPAQFTLSSVLDSVMPAISPIVSGPNKCEAIKSVFGLTYEQMSERNSTDVHDVLNIDLITKNGNVKHNLTMTKRMAKILEGAKNIVILVHGFLESSEGLMVNGLSPGLLKQQGLKILALDGRKLVNLEYFRSSTYARFMGERLGTCLGQMVEKGQDPSKLILIGHSLGAHISGIAGKRLHQLTGQRAGRIIALDPASPCFGNVGPAGRLVQTDAAYVIVVHTNTGTFGLTEPVANRSAGWSSSSWTPPVRALATLVQLDGSCRQPRRMSSWCTPILARSALLNQ
ncbi:lipase domain-containing protein [Phthorimaea operculella]|nr:lipase domain-containing protein [Phthorimaea operculella]